MNGDGPGSKCFPQNVRKDLWLFRWCNRVPQLQVKPALFEPNAELFFGLWDLGVPCVLSIFNDGARTQELTYTFQGQKNLPTSSKAYLQGSHVDCQVLYQIWEAFRTVGEVREKKLWQLRMALKSLVSQVPLLAFQLPIVPGESVGIYGNSEASLVETTNQPMMCPANTFPPIWSCARPPQLQSAAKATVLSLAVAISGLAASHFFPHWARSIWCILGLSKLDPSPTWNLCKSLHGKISSSVKTSTSPLS